MKDSAPPPQLASGPSTSASTLEPQASLDRSIRDGCAHAVMLGAGEAYLSPFAIALGAGSVVVGLLASVPLVVGALSQIVAVKLLERWRRRKALVLVPAMVQGFSWLPLFLLPVLFREHGLGPALVVAAAVLYFAAGSFVLPPWNSWMGELVTPERRGDYFGRRDRLRTACQMAGLVAGGAVLGLAGRADHVFLGFAVVFGVAALGRFVSAYHLSRMVEPPYEAALAGAGPGASFAELFRGAFRDNFGRFTIYLACVQGATHIAGPFFTLYMLRDLELSYFEFTAASAVCIFAQALAFHNWGKVGDQFGNLAVLKFTGFCLPFLPLLWLISPRFEAVLVYQVISGVVWAGFNLSAANFIFDSVPPARRPHAVAFYNLMVNSGILVGATMGGSIVRFLPKEISVLGVVLPLVSNLQVLFLISGVLRLIIGLFVLPLLREVRPVEQTSVWKVFVRVVGVQPIRGLRFSIFIGVHPKEVEDKGSPRPSVAGERGRAEQPGPDGPGDARPA